MQQGTATAEQVLRARSSFDELYGRLQAIRAHEADSFAVGSPAAKDAEALDDLEAVGTITAQCSFYLEHAADHLSALARLLDAPVITMPVWTLARGVLESSAWACWLSTLEIKAKERLARSMAIHRKGQFDELGLASLSGRPELRARVEAAQRGLRDSAARRGIRLGGPPNIGQVVDQAFGSGVGLDYKLLSGMTHAAPNVILRMAYEIDEVSKVAERVAYPVPLLLWTLSSIEWFARAAWGLAAYGGRDLRPYATAFERTFDSLEFLSRPRFWRGSPELTAWYGQPQ